MAKIDESVQKEWIKNLWMNCNKQGVKNETLWSRVSEMVNAFNGELQMQRDNSRMTPDSVPVGVDCTLSPVLPSGSTSGQTTRNEFTSAATTATAATAVSTATSSSTESPVKRVVCSPDLPVYPLVSAARPAEEVRVDSSTQSKQATQGMLQKIYRCTICSDGFNQKVSLTAHLKTHTKESEDPYRCNFCGKTFAVPARLTRHYRTHTGEKPYQCEYCKKAFSVKENLSVHKRIHTKERPYKCDVCERAFEHSGKLHRHMRIHTGERPHKCNFCSKTFIQSGQLVIHLRTHTGEKPYVCKCCNKGFTCSKQLKVHTRTHTGEKPYACDICGKSFGYNHVLKLHQVAHYGEKVYKCTICKQTFTSKKAMETHIKMSHSDSNPARNHAENELSSASSASDKENKIELQPVSSIPSMPEARPISHSPVYESYLQTCSSSAASVNVPNTSSSLRPVQTTGDMKSFTSALYPPQHGAHNQGGLNSALLAAAAAANEELVMTYQSESNPMATSAAHPSKFQIPAAAGAQYYAGSPSSYSDSSRSSPSPKLEIVEPQDETSIFILPDYATDLRYQQRHPDLLNATAADAASSSVIIQLPYTEGGALTPSSSSSSSPVPSSPDIIDLPNMKEERNLPPRKRTKMILESMEKDKMEDVNYRYNSVIQYAKASQIA